MYSKLVAGVYKLKSSSIQYSSDSFLLVPNKFNYGLGVFLFGGGDGAYLEPYLEVESGARMAGGVEKPESDAAVDAAAEENGDSEALVGHGTAEVGVELAMGGGGVIRRRRGGRNCG